MLETALHDRHVLSGARMMEFAGWDMPLLYEGVIEEHMAVRTRAGAFDVSHMGNLLIRGARAADLMDRLCTNDIASAPLGRCIYSHLLDDDGHILDDTIATVIGEDEFFMVPNAATTPKMRSWIEGHLSGHQELVDESHRLSGIAVQGPRAKDILGELTSADLTSMAAFWARFVMLDRLGTDGARPTTELLTGRDFAGDASGIASLLSRTGYTGEDGFEIFMENENAPEVWDAVIRKGGTHGLMPAGLGARDTLRLEKGFLLSGTDFDGRQTSVQTGPPWVIDWGHDFLGKGALESQKMAGDYQRLVGLEANDRGVPRHGYDILLEERTVGLVTSGTYSPVLKKGIAMGYVPLGHAKTGTELQIKIRENFIQVSIVKPPFVKKGSR